MPKRVSSSRLIGRTAEIERAAEAIRDLDRETERHHASLFMISGEAGIGKSRFLADMLNRANDDGVIAVCGRCLEHGDEIRPLGALVEILTELTELTEPTAAVDHALASYPTLHSIVSLSRPSPSPRSSHDPAAVHHEMRTLLQSLTRTKPMVMAVEDLHWADRSTRELLADLAQAPGLGRLLIVLTFRSDELHRRHPLLPFLAELERAMPLDQVELEPLNGQELGRLAADILGQPLAEIGADDLARRSGGNPFYAEELLAAGPALDHVPDGVRYVILARSQDLGPEAEQCLQAATVLADPVDGLVLQATAALDSDRYSAAVDELCRENFLIENGGRFRFRHDLVREVFLDELLPGERTQLYGRAAAALSDHQPDHWGEIARLRFSAIQLPESLAASVQAAIAAEDLGAPAEASGHYARALDIWHRIDEPADWADISHLELLRRAASAANRARQFDVAVELGRQVVNQAEKAGPGELGSALHDQTIYLWNAGAPGLDEVLDLALEVLPADVPSKERAQVEVRNAGRLSRQGRHEEADRALGRAGAMAAVLGETAIEATTLAHIGLERAQMGDEEKLSEIYRARDLATTTDDGFVITRIDINLSNVLLFLGRFDEVIALYPDGIARAERHGLMATNGLLLQSNMLEALEAAGRWDEAQTIVDDLRRRHSPESIHHWASALVGWAQIQINRGNHLDVASIYERGFELRETGYYSGDLASLGTGMVELAAAGVIDPVEPPVIEAWLGELPVSETALGARLVSAAARYLTNRPTSPPSTGTDDTIEENAATVSGWIDRLQRLADDNFISTPPLLDAWLDQARGELGDATGTSTPSAWADLAGAWDAMGCPYLAAEARFRQANTLMLRSGGRSAPDRTTSTDLLADAHRTASDLGAQPLMDSIIDLARRARLSLDVIKSTESPDVDPSGAPRPFGLTPRELEVLLLVTEGRSNGQIGNELFVSTKTASVHVSNILRKLGAANRIEAAAIARRHRLGE